MVVVYLTSVSSNMEIKKQQQKIEMVLDGKKIKYEKVDIASDEDAKDKMREIVGDPKALPPQLCDGDKYLGDFAAFEEAIENEELEVFLKL